MDVIKLTQGLGTRLHWHVPVLYPPVKCTENKHIWCKWKESEKPAVNRDCTLILLLVFLVNSKPSSDGIADWCVASNGPGNKTTRCVTRASNAVLWLPVEGSSLLRALAAQASHNIKRLFMGVLKQFKLITVSAAKCILPSSKQGLNTL